MTLEKLLQEYLNQYPKSEDLMPLIYGLGEKKTKEILLKRNRREINILTDERRIDWVGFEYVEI